MIKEDSEDVKEGKRPFMHGAHMIAHALRPFLAMRTTYSCDISPQHHAKKCKHPVQV
jgi:hypothetical protein